MKKKNMVLVVTMLLVACYAALGVFALAQEGEEAPAPERSLIGAWRVASYYSGGTVTLIPSEFMVFTEEKAADYRDSFETPFAESDYSVEGTKLQLPGLKRSFEMNWCSDHVLQLYASPDEYTELIWYSGLDAVPAEVDRDRFNGTWNIVYRRGLDQIGTEVLVIDGATLTDYRNGSTEPTVTVDLSWNEEGQLVAPRLAKIYAVYPNGADEWYLVETDTGFIWQLVRVEP